MKINIHTMDDADYKREATNAITALEKNRLIMNAYAKELSAIQAYIRNLEAKIIGLESTQPIKASSDLLNEVKQIRKSIGDIYCKQFGHSWINISLAELGTAYRYTTATQKCSVCGIANDCI